jgi:hypothetical protein
MNPEIDNETNEILEEIKKNSPKNRAAAEKMIAAIMSADVHIIFKLQVLGAVSVGKAWLDYENEHTFWGHLGRAAEETAESILN